MRTRHWLAALMGGCMALAGVGTATAQPPMPSNGNPDQVGMGMLPSPYSTGYGQAQPSYSGMNSAGYPAGANPWPGVSPYMGPPVDSTSYEDGFWYNRIMQGNRQYYFSVDAIFGHGSKPGTTLIGAPNVNPQTADGVSGITGGTTSTTTTTSLIGLTQFNQAPPGTGPIRSIGATGGGGGGQNGSTGGSVIIFGSQNTGVLADTLNSTGIRGTWGWTNTDGTGLVASGFMQNRSTTTFSLVDPLLVIDPNNANFNPLLHLHAWYGLPLGGADTDGTSLNGTVKDGAVIPYDMGVRVSFSSRLAGANTDWYFNPLFEGNNVKVRPTAGAKYIRLQEDFLFDAYDSGLGYTVNNSSTTAGGGTGSTTTGGTGFLTPSVLEALFTNPNVLHTRLDSSTLANMAGPEIGFRVDLGGKKFQLWTQTKVGALANVTQRQISGFGVGNGFNIITPNTVPVMPNDPSKTAFSNSQTTTTMSPMFEQQINVKMPIFNLVPYLNRMEIFERAQLTGGYTFLFLGDVYRPQNAIIWNQFPNTPQLNSQKSNYYNSMFNVGVEWTY